MTDRFQRHKHHAGIEIRSRPRGALPSDVGTRISGIARVQSWATPSSDPFAAAALATAIEDSGISAMNDLCDLLAFAA